MEVRSCRSCGKLYNYLGAMTPACPACMKAMEEKFQTCKEYIRDNPGANIQTVAEETDTSIKMIKQWVREERLTFAEGSVVGIECEGCGASILTGRYCASCKFKMQQNLMNAARRPASPQSDARDRKTSDNKMRFLDR